MRSSNIVKTNPVQKGLLRYTEMHKLLREEIADIANQYKWQEQPFDFDTGKIEYISNCRSIVIYVTKMTVGYTIKGITVWNKEQSLEDITNLFRRLTIVHRPREIVKKEESKQRTTIFYSDEARKVLSSKYKVKSKQKKHKTKVEKVATWYPNRQR